MLERQHGVVSLPAQLAVLVPALQSPEQLAKPATLARPAGLLVALALLVLREVRGWPGQQRSSKATQ